MLPKLKLQPHLFSNVPLAPLGSAVCSPPGLRAGAKMLTPPAKSLWRRDTGSTSPYPRSWSRQGRNSSFSRQNQPSLGDTSLDSLKRRTRSISNCLQRFQARRLEVETIIRARERKKRLAELLRRRFGIKFSLLDLKTLSEDAMTRRAVERRSWQLAHAAAGQMIAWATRARIDRNLHFVHAREHMAAFCIQKQWKRYTARVIQPRRAREERERAAVTIQRCYRGYLSRQRTMKARVLRDVNNLHFHYERVRFRCLLEKAPIIARAWQRCSKRMKKAEAKRRVSKLFSGFVADVFKTSSKAPPMRANIDRPNELQLAASTFKKMRSEAVEPKSALAQVDKTPLLLRGRSRTDPNNEVVPHYSRSSSRKLTHKSSRESSPPSEEPKTAPVNFKLKTRKPIQRLARIEEIS